MAGEPRHVLHVLNGAAGGAALSTLGLIEALRARGVESSAVCHDFGSPTERRQIAEAVGGRLLMTPLYWWNRKIRLPAWKRPLSELRQLWRTRWKRRSTALVADFARRNAVDLIHSNTILTVEGGLASRQLGLPHVWHVRELVGPGHPYRFACEGPALGRFLQTLAEKVIANSEATATAIRAWLPPGLLEVVPNGIDLSRFVPRPPGDARSAARRGDGWQLDDAVEESPVAGACRRPGRSGLADRVADLWARSFRWGPARRRSVRQSAPRGDSPPGPGRSLPPGRFSSRSGRDYGTNRHPGASGRERIVRPDRCRSHGGRAARRRLRRRWRGRDRPSRPDRFFGSPARSTRWPAMSSRLAGDADLRSRMGAAGRQLAQDCYSLDACAEGVLRVYRAARRDASLEPESFNRAAVDPRNASTGNSVSIRG